MSNACRLTDRKRTLIFLNIMISCIASSMLATALTTALPPIIQDLHVSVSTGQLLTSGYSLAMGITMPLTAFLITRFPTRRLYLAGLGIFMIGLLTCAVAPNFSVMITARILQACGSGILTSMSQVVLLIIYPLEKRGTIMGWYGLSIGAAPVIAPTLAGVIVDLFGWKYIFYIVAAIIAVSFLCALFVFDDVLDVTKKKFDVLSFVISAAAFAGITLGIGNIGTYPILDWKVLPLLAVGLLAGYWFVRRQLKSEQPFLELRVLKSKEYALSVIGSMLLYLVMMGSAVIMPLYVQSILGYSATVSGLVTLPGSLAMAVVSPFAGRIYDRLGMKKLFVTGALCMLASNLGMAFITMQMPVWTAGAFYVVRCAAIGCLMMPFVTWGNSHVEKKLMADGTALLISLRTIAGAIGTAAFVGIMTTVAEKQGARYGENAAIHGLNVAFLSMSFATLILLLIAVFLVKNKKTNHDS